MRPGERDGASTEGRLLPVSDERWVRSGAPDRPELVATHTWHREAPYYADLAAVGDYQVLSILPPNPEAGPLPRRVEQWVDHHEAVLQSLPIEPPYRLVGWSFGGVVALELARRLKARGAEVAFVGLIDTIRPRLLPLSTSEYVWYHLGAAAAMSDEAGRIAYLRRHGLFLLHRRFPKTGTAALTLLEHLGVRKARGVKRPNKVTDPLMKSVRTSYLNYRGDVVPFPVSLYATDSSVQRAGEPALRWLEWLHAGYEFVPIPGGHYTLFDPEHIGGLAAAIRVSLARAAAEDPT